ncbi:MAG: DciA family protein [Verrucomicrobiota bacterium]
MPAPTDSAKRNEVATYKKLNLTREHKSIRRRRLAEASRLYRYIGENSVERPYIKVLKNDYIKLWHETKTKLCPRSSPNNAQLRQIEKQVYDELAQKQNLVADLDASFQKKHGRGMTPRERSIYNDLIQQANLSAPAQKVRMRRKTLLNDLLEKIEYGRKNSPVKLQQAWATLVGEEIAQQTLLERIDSQNGLAICRCFNSTLAFQLRRKKDLAKNLAQALHSNIQRIVFRS